MQLTSVDEVRTGTSQTKLGPSAPTLLPKVTMLSLTFSLSALAASYFYKQCTTEIDF